MKFYKINFNYFKIHLDLARYHELGRFIYKSLSVSANEENFNNEKTNINGITGKIFYYSIC